MTGDAVTRAVESPPSNTPSDDDMNGWVGRGVGRGVGGRGAGGGVVPVPRPELDCETRVHGVSPLLLATLHGRADIVELLLRAGAARDVGSTIRRVLGDDR